MPALAVPTTVVAPDQSTTAIREDWSRMATYQWTPLDTVDYSARMTVTATVDEGTVGEVRFRVAGSGNATLPQTVSGPSENLLMPWLNLGVGAQSIILEARRTSGDGGLRILAASGVIADSALVSVDPAPAAGNALATLGPLLATAAATFSTTFTNTGAPVISGTPGPGFTLSTSTGTWSVVPSSFQFQWESEAPSATPTNVTAMPGHGAAFIDWSPVAGATDYETETVPA